MLGIVALGALLRFWHLGHQSLWLDEAYTHNLVRKSLGGMLSTIPHTESTPPLYYLLQWGVSQVLGTGAAAMRALSAVCGVLAIPVAYAAGRELVDERAGLLAALLVAVNPYFVWYSQEARAYSLLVLMAALSIYAFARVLRRRTAGAAALWGVVAALALLTHYFAAFLVVPEAAYLLYATRSRWVALATLLPLATAAALTPLALDQRRSGHAQWIGNLSLSRRLEDLPKKFVTGELGLPLPVLGALAGVVVVGALAWAAIRSHGRRRDRLILMLGLAVACVVIPIALSAVGLDYVFARNLIALYVPLALAAGIAFAVTGRLGLAAAGLVCAVAIVVNAFVAYDPKVQRDDWRGLARTLGPASAPRAFVLGPGVQEPAFSLYAGRSQRVGAEGVTVREVDAVLDTRPPRSAVPVPPPGFRLAAVRRTASWMLVRYTAAAPIPLNASQLLAAKLGSEPPIALVQGRGTSTMSTFHGGRGASTR